MHKLKAKKGNYSETLNQIRYNIKEETVKTAKFLIIYGWAKY